MAIGMAPISTGRDRCSLRQAGCRRAGGARSSLRPASTMAVGRGGDHFKTGGKQMLTKLRLLLYGLLLALAIPVAAQAKTIYWISHGGPADPVWTYFLAGAEPVGAGYRQYGQHLVPQWRRALAAGSHPRGDRRQGRRHRHHQPRSGQPGRGRQGGARRRHPDHQLQHAGPDRRLQRLCRRRHCRWSARAGPSTWSTRAW